MRKERSDSLRPKRGKKNKENEKETETEHACYEPKTNRLQFSPYIEDKTRDFKPEDS